MFYNLQQMHFRSKQVQIHEVQEKVIFFFTLINSVVCIQCTKTNEVHAIYASVMEKLAISICQNTCFESDANPT